MGDKKISDIVDAVDQQFKELERKKKLVERVQGKAQPKPVMKELNPHQEKMRELKEQQKFRLKEKLAHAVVVFTLGHMVLIPLYMKYPQYAVNMFLFASISLGVICIAVIDYT